MGRKETKDKKPVQYRKIYELLSKYSQIVVVGLMNVGSRQVQDIRRILSKRDATLLIGKNTLIRTVLAVRQGELEKSHPYYEDLSKFGPAIKELEALRNQVTGKVGFIFSNEPVFELRPLIESNKVETAAKVGALAPIDVVIAPGATGMDPSQISFFHALQISTKIEKGQIQIVKDFVACRKGERVGQSQAALLQKLGKKPFQYGMEVLSCYESGSILNKAQVAISLNDILNNFKSGASNIAAISLSNGWANEASIPHLMINAFKNLAAIGLQTGYEFEQLKGSSQPAPQAQQQQAPKQEVKKVEEVKKEEPEEDVDLGGMFDF